MGLALVAEEEDDGRDVIALANIETSSTPPPAPRRALFNFSIEHVMAALTGVAAILGARGAVFMHLALTFALALTVSSNPTTGALMALSLFSIPGFISVTWLCATRNI